MGDGAPKFNDPDKWRTTAIKINDRLPGCVNFGNAKDA